MEELKKLKVAVIVAHPDDETLWCGGTILNHPEWECLVISLCRGHDPDRAPKFYRVMHLLGTWGVMGDLDDGPEQVALPDEEVQNLILQLLPSTYFDLILTHDPGGEYTQHRRHEETSKAVIHLWNKGKITTGELWTFAYQDGKRSYLPVAVNEGTYYTVLPEKISYQKYSLITIEYGFDLKSWEARTSPVSEAFRQFKTPGDAMKWLTKRSIDESADVV